MDESFLSQPKVIAESRRFVCIRLATYEDEEEAKLLKRIFVGRSGDLENTTFALLSPDGKRLLARPGRGPSFAFGRSQDADERMARFMMDLASQFHRKRGAPAPQLPKMTDTRLALNVASCDNLPLVVLLAPEAGMQRQLEKRLAALAWSSKHIGRFVYASTREATDLKYIEGVAKTSSVIVIQPGPYGLTGQVLGQTSASTDDSAFDDLLSQCAQVFKPSRKEMRTHITKGIRQGVEWETLLPVTDPGSRGRRR